MMYQDRVLAFIDVLGFSDKIKNTMKNDKEDETKTEKIYNLFRDAQSLINKKYPDSVNGESTKVANQFSDSILISHSFTEKAGVFHILADVLFLCVAALQKGFLFRGAIVCDKLCHEETIIFGPALVNAVEMEKSLAIYPRIILNKEIIDIAEKYPADWPSKNEQTKVINKLISKDFDGLYYINYFDAINYVVGENDGVLEYFNSLRIIIDNLEKDQKDKICLRSKYLWIKEKYNNTLKGLQKNYCNDHVKIDSPDLYNYLLKTPYF